MKNRSLSLARSRSSYARVTFSVASSEDPEEPYINPSEA